MDKIISLWLLCFSVRWLEWSFAIFFLLPFSELRRVPALICDFSQFSWLKFSSLIFFSSVQGARVVGLIGCLY